MPWHVYILRCRDNKLYTGITSDLKRRIREHKSGKGCRFTRFRIPLKLVYSSGCGSKPDALKREHEIKSLSRGRKLALIRSKWSSKKP